MQQSRVIAPAPTGNVQAYHTYETPLQYMELSVLMKHCSAESERFYRGQEHDTRYSYELFRRAWSNVTRLPGNNSINTIPGWSKDGCGATVLLSVVARAANILWWVPLPSSGVQ